jgi:hypothetical protein
MDIQKGQDTLTEMQQSTTLNECRAYRVQAAMSDEEG